MASKKKKRRRNHSLLPFAAAIFIILVIVIIVLTLKFSSSKEQTDLDAYYSMDADTNTATNTAVILNNTLADSRAIVSDGGLYLGIGFIQDYLNARFYWEPESDLLIYTTPTDVIKVTAGDSNYYIGNSQTAFERVILKEADGTAYVSADFVKNYTAMDYAVYDTPSRVVINTNYTDAAEVATVKKATQIRVEPSIKSEIVASPEKGTSVTILSEDADAGWDQVITADGFFGYIKANKLSDASSYTATTDFVAPEYTSQRRNYTINMAWHQVTNYSANSTLEDVLYGTDGINVISPTWFYLDDNSGNIADLASDSYVTYAHQNGLEVWALVSNFENEEVDTTAVLTNTENREHLEAQLLSAAIEYKLDGINIDFESLSSDVGDSFIQFIRELSILCRKNDIVLSIDNYAPTAYTAFYDRAEQAAVADYVILMAYDEHNSTTGAGSVASLDWVQEGIVNTLEEVPADSLILGIPFYTRLWTTDISNNVSCSSMSMASAWDWVSTNGLDEDVTWDSTTSQYYVKDIQENTIYEMWLEDADSISAKVALKNQYGLAGTSAWKLGMETSDVWAVINQ